ncbi:MAG TPA: response regulator [Gemmatimonadaceae bacterium]|nr:response regulator [Gemmatimonadaceae bacterium]
MTNVQPPSVLDRANVRAVVRRLFGLGLLALGGVIATLSLIAIVQLVSRSEILQGRQVTLLARDINTLLIDRQAGVRGYLLTTDTTGLASGIASRAQLYASLDSLRSVTGDDPAWQGRIDRLRRLVGRWDASFVDPELAAAGRGDFDSARRIAAQSTALTDSARQTSADLVARAVSRLRERDRSMVAVRWASAGTLLLEIIGLFLIMRRMRSRLLAQAEEVFQQQEHLEMQATQLEEQQAELEQQMAALQQMTGDLESSNAELGSALDAAAAAGEALRERDAELRRTNARLGALFEAAPLAVCAVDAQGVVRQWNPAAQRMFGWTAAQAVGQRLPMFPGSGELPVLNGDTRAVKTDVPGVATRSDGSTFEVSMSWGPVDDDPANGYVVTFADMTDRKRLEAQLMQAQKMEAVGRLAGGVAHDFNNMLTAIKSYSQLLLQDVAADDARHKDIQEIDLAADRAARLTRQLLAFSRQQMLQPRVLDVNQTVSELEKMLQRLLLKDITLSTRLAPELHAVRADAGQLEQVIVNLVVNARDAMPDGGRLTVRTQNVTLDAASAREGWSFAVRPGAYVLISVTDTGLGMDEATKSRIFEPFFTTKDRHKGTGLGLSTVYGIVKQSGGYIRVISAPGEGSTFEVFLPVADGAASPAGQPPRPQTSGGSETVLVVEDDDGIRAVIKRILERAGHRVLEATNGAEALRICDASGDSIDLVLSDIAMPEMQGPDLARRIRELHPHMAMLLMSGYAESASQQEGFLTDGVEFLGKPFSPDALTRKIRHILDGAA